MLKAFFLLTSIPLIAMSAEMRLDHLCTYDEKTCVEILQSAELKELWNYFLQGQTTLYFDQEAKWFSQQDSWNKASSVLEMGSGNGVFLSHLSNAFKDKSYLGLETQDSLVNLANETLAKEGLTFVIGDAETEYTEYQDQFDVVLYRNTLQHLKNPKQSLELSYQYLKKDGYLFIIDAYDPVRKSSHRLSYLENRVDLFNKNNLNKKKGNRKITLEILEDVQNNTGSLSKLYDLVYTNLDQQGESIGPSIKLSSVQDRERYFNHSLLFMAILWKGYNIPIDLTEIYKELHIYLDDTNSWICPGIHMLILKKS